MKYFLVSALILFTLSSYSQKKAEFQSTKIQTDILVNGIGDEWPQPFQFSDDKITYGISNNDNYVYLLVQSFDRTIQQKIMRSGITLNISTKGKQRVKLIVNYPMRSSGDNPTRQQMQNPTAEIQQARQSLEGRNLRMSSNTAEMKIKGFETVNGIIPAKNEDGINAAISWEGEALITYELAIPIEEITGGNSLQDSEDLAIQMKLQINAIPQPTPGGGGGSSTRSSGGGSRGGRGGGGGRSGGGGGMPQGGARSGGSQAEMFTHNVFKATFTLKVSE